MDKGFTFQLIVIVLLFFIIFIVAVLFLTFGKDYLNDIMNELPPLFGGKK
ncbi:MAG: hypothetical protein V1944_00310 [Candidatus Aenigmatarchaeota archaeon]